MTPIAEAPSHDVAKLVERLEQTPDRNALTQNTCQAQNSLLIEAATALESLSRDLARKDAELELLRDHGGDAVELAGRILENLGIGQDASKEPGADRRRDRIASMIERYLSRDLAEARAALQTEREDCAVEAEHALHGVSLVGIGHDLAQGMLDGLHIAASAIRARSVLPQKEADSNE